MFRCRDEQKRWESLHGVSELTVRQRIVKEKSRQEKKIQMIKLGTQL